MPVLDFLSDYKPDDHSITENIGIKLNAVMLYPTDFQRREEYIIFNTTRQAQIHARRKRGEPFATITGNPETDISISRLVDMQRNDGGELSSRIHAGSIAGRRLHYVSAIQASGERGSFNTADKLIHKPYARNSEKLKDQEGQIIATAPAKIKDAWNIFHPVAHLWAAFNLYPGLYGDESALNNPKRFIPLAEWFREFGENNMPGKGYDTYLNPESTWRPPESFHFDKLTDTPPIILWAFPTDKL